MNFETSFKKDLIQKMEEKKLSPNSIKMYIRNLEKLNNNQPLKSLAFLKDTTDITEKLANYKENTKRGYYISIVSALSLDKGTKAKEKLYNTYYNLMMDKNKQLADVPSSKMTETQKDNWISWNDVEEKMKQLETAVNKFAKLKEITEAQYNTLLDYVILSLYVLIEPRRNQDYQKMNIAKGMTELPDKYNYLDLDANKFVFNIYKTARKYGKKDIDIPDSLREVLDVYLKFHPLYKNKKQSDTPFLVYSSGKPLDKVNSITRILNKVFEKKVGSSMLRHIFLSDKFGKVSEEQQRVADNMGHSVSQQRDYIKEI
jgi:hypothetical protein